MMHKRTVQIRLYRVTTLWLIRIRHTRQAMLQHRINAIRVIIRRALLIMVSIRGNNAT